jgi:hypothetical protein
MFRVEFVECDCSAQRDGIQDFRIIKASNKALKILKIEKCVKWEQNKINLQEERILNFKRRCGA